jgi:hypothetical protein
MALKWIRVLLGFGVGISCIGFGILLLAMEFFLALMAGVMLIGLGLIFLAYALSFALVGRGPRGQFRGRKRFLTLMILAIGLVMLGVVMTAIVEAIMSGDFVQFFQDHVFKDSSSSVMFVITCAGAVIFPLWAFARAISPRK